MHRLIIYILLIVTALVIGWNIETYDKPVEHETYLSEYSSFIHIWRFFSFILTLGILYLLAFSKLSAKFRDLAYKIKNKFLSVWVYFILIMAAYYILKLPFTIFRGYLVEDSFGFINQSFYSWLSEGLLSQLILMIVGIVPVWFFYQLVNKYKKWWLYYTAGMIPFMIITVVLVPVFISPMFNDFIPLKDQQLKAEIETLTEKVGIEDADIFEVNASKQSSKINAYVTGLFNTKRIVLYDTMIKNFTYDEIKFVMAHEMGHYVKNHLWWGLSVAVLFVCFLLWLTHMTIHRFIDRTKRFTNIKSLGDIASVPIVLLFLFTFNFILQPITNLSSRYMERQCDIYAMDISSVSKDDAVSTFQKLSTYNLSDPEPHPIIEFWFYSHPSLQKRIEFVKSYKN